MLSNAAPDVLQVGQQQQSNPLPEITQLRDRVNRLPAS